MRYLILCLLLLIGASGMAQKLDFHITSEFQYDLKRASDLVNLFSLDSELPTETLRLWKGGSLQANFISIFNLGDEVPIVSEFGLSTINNSNLSFQILKLGYAQNFKNLFFYIGIRDLCMDYFIDPISPLFLNGNSTLPTPLSDAITIPTYPTSAPAIHLAWQISSTFNFKISAYNGRPKEFTKDGINFFAIAPHKDGVIGVSALEYRYNKQNKAYVSIGGIIKSKHDNPENTNQREDVSYAFWTETRRHFMNIGRVPLSVQTVFSFAPERFADYKNYYSLTLIADHIFKKMETSKYGFTFQTTKNASEREYYIENTFFFPVRKYLAFQGAYTGVIANNKWYNVLLIRAYINLNLLAKFSKKEKLALH